MQAFNSDKIVDPILAQNEEYSFPYHYVSEFHNGRFKQHFVDTWGINYALTLDFIINRVNELQPTTVIDIGCGDGRLTRELTFCSSTPTVVGIDYSERAIQLAMAMNSDAPQIKFEAVDIMSAHELGSFDVAVLMEVFEHIPLTQAKDFMKAVRRLVRPKGKLLVTVPHTNKPLEYKHFQHFTSESLLRYIEPHFTIDEVLPFEKKTWSRRKLNKILCNRLFVLNNYRLLSAIYQYHKSRLFYCRSEADCQRLFVQATAS